MTNKDMKQVSQWKDAQRVQILDSGTITGMVAAQVNAVLSSESSSKEEKEMVLKTTQALGYLVSQASNGSYIVTKIQVPGMNWEAA